MAAGRGHWTVALMYIPQGLEGTHGASQGLLLSSVIPTGEPQLAIPKTKRLLGFRNSFRQSG